MERKGCVDCEEQDPVILDNNGDELCATCYNKRKKNKD